VFFKDERKATLTFYGQRTTHPGERQSLTFDVIGCMIATFGYPNDEALGSHPLYASGLRQYAVFEVIDSSWKRGVIEQNLRSFPVNPPHYESLRHFVVTFQDSTFECLAQELIARSREVGKSTEQLDEMVVHIRYEIEKLIEFLRIGNTWVKKIDGLPDEHRRLASESMLEAALIHTRCIAEFLRHSGEPEDTITARDYEPGWHWTKGEGLKDDLAEIHGRVAHLGLIRRSVQRDDENFSWYEFLTGTAVPTLLGGFGEFLGRLDSDRVQQFNQARPNGLPRIDLAAKVTSVLL